MDDLDAVLTYAAGRKLISKDEHYGEVAHSLTYAPRERQVALISIIAKGNSGYALEILASGINATSAKKLDPAAARRLAALLNANEPSFPTELSGFGYRDILRYNYWLNATALLHELSGMDSYNATVLVKLSDAETDPRKVLGFLGSPEGERIIATAQDRKLLAAVAKRAISYARSFPQDWLLNNMAARIELAIAAR